VTSLQITYFLKVAERMSFSRAAQELYVSQPSVTRQVQQLEKELGFELIDRNSRKFITLSPAGMIFRDAFLSARKGLDQARLAAMEASDSRTPSLRIGIGLGWDMAAELEQFREWITGTYPRAELSFSCENFQRLHQLLAQGELDVVVCTKTSIQNYDSLDIMEIADNESRVYVRKGLLGGPDRPLQIRDFRGQKLLMLPEEEVPLSSEIICSQFLAHRVSLEVVRMPNRDSILQAVLLGEGIAVFDQYMYFRDDPRLEFCRLEDSIPICAAWNRRNKNPLIRLFAEFFREIQKS